MSTIEEQRNRQLEHLSALLERFEHIRAFQAQEDRLDQHGNYQWDERDAAMCTGFVTRAYDVIRSIVPPDSPYAQQALGCFAGLGRSYDSYQMKSSAELMASLVQELYSGLSLGNLDSYVGLIHAQLFDDFISMAQYLQDEGYKDAAAVICGGTLESHLRQLATKHGIDIMVNGKRKKAERLNADLGKLAYTLYDQKMVTAWLDIRNSAAHGDYDDYTTEQVQQFIDWLADFIRRNPA